jgi:acetylornithine deacetylase/succinyl-diaminopimelate desuccinylase-like protein
MLRTSVSPNVIAGGYRSNVIPSEATATLDVRMLPDEDPDRFLAEMKKVVNYTSVEVRFQGASFGRPTGRRQQAGLGGVQGDRIRRARVYDVPTIPTMGRARPTCRSPEGHPVFRVRPGD